MRTIIVQEHVTIMFQLEITIAKMGHYVVIAISTKPHARETFSTVIRLHRMALLA